MDPMLVWGLGLLVAALLLLFLEAFVPSGGILALVSVVVAIAGVVVMFRYETVWGIASITGVAFVIPAFGWFMVNIFPDTPMGRRFILGGSRESSDEEEGPGSPRSARQALIGSEGNVSQALRPVGFVTIDGTRYEALSDTGDVLDPGTRVRVIGITMHELRVRRV